MTYRTIVPRANVRVAGLAALGLLTAATLVRAGPLEVGPLPVFILALASVGAGAFHVRTAAKETSQQTLAAFVLAVGVAALVAAVLALLALAPCADRCL